VEVHVASATSTSAKTVGVQNAAGTIGATASGFNGTTNTTLANVAYRFNPPVNYTFAWTASPSSTITDATAGNTTAAPVVGSNTYSVVITNPLNGCQKNDNATVVVDPTTVAGTLSVDNAVGCAGANSGTVSLAGNTGSVTRWEFSTDGAVWSTLGGASGSSYAYSNLTGDRWYRVAEERKLLGSIVQ